eukprot:TRINITY_DN182_c0_g2_i1.p2 TRINITY_DN182_c0_g2~~TRINITY_DN182_c0_g2_i1.p2  ORF type:complete len:187 (+),score=59.32 TRINITY_DN182_c0_g2_i1:60-620(+)
MCIRDRYQRRVRDTFKQLETMLLVLCVVACVALINAHDLIEPVRVGGAVSRKRQATEEDLGAASPCKDSELAICARTQDMCCPAGSLCCEVAGKGVGCAPPDGLCCDGVAEGGHACKDGQECCGDACMPVGAVCCEKASAWCDASHVCSEAQNSCIDPSIEPEEGSAASLSAVATFAMSSVIVMML